MVASIWLIERRYAGSIGDWDACEFEPCETAQLAESYVAELNDEHAGYMEYRVREYVPKDEEAE